MDSCNFTNKANSHTPKVEICRIMSIKMTATYRTKIVPFWPLCCESAAILSKKFRPGYPGWSVHMETFSSGYREPRSR